MKKIRIVADSSCDLFSLDGVELCTAPMKVSTDEREFVDGDTLDVGEMVDYLYKYKGRSRSSCPNVGDWLEAFGDAEEIYCITITRNLSGSYNSARIAAEQYERENAGRRVYVFDTLSAGPELSLIIYRIRELVLKGQDFDGVVALVNEYMKHTGLVFMLKSVKTFANNGRISPIMAKLVGIAGICIIGKASDEGTLQPIHKSRGEAKSLTVLVDSLEEDGYRGGKVSIGHCENEAAAEKVKQLILGKYPDAHIEIHKFRGLCSFYAERGGVLVGFEKG